MLMAKSTTSLKTVERTPVDYTDRLYWSGIIKMSLSKFFILSVLQSGPCMAMRSHVKWSVRQGCCAPTEGTIYPVLREFEQGGYVTAHTETVAGRRRKVYTLTDKGREAFTVAVDAWMEVAAHITRQ